jgi:mutator protein MutT
MTFVEVAAGLLFREGKLLITRRFQEAHLGGLWEFPGGKLEPGETFAQCLKRELLEELGCKVEVLESVDSISHVYPEKSVRIEFLRCRWIEQEPEPIGCADLRWIEPNELSHFNFPAADAKLLDVLRVRRDLWAS